MSEIKPPLKNYLHAFTLYEETQGKRRNTSQTARDAYTDALKVRGYRPWYRNADGIAVHLPQATMIGTFVDATLAVTAVKAAEIVAKQADPGKFFLESSIVTRWTRARLCGTPLDPQPATKVSHTISSQQSKEKNTLKTFDEYIDQEFKR